MKTITATTLLLASFVLSGCFSEKEPKRENWDQMMNTEGSLTYEDVLKKYAPDDETTEEHKESPQEKK